ncbi:uncharacterized protein LOC129792415 [Lutzomyia longipalpis]|uniref:uncharacterized protein LOC129792415 n=1 Tax=Lutzomyia longipalpis TaxID=7200 RepID=UPI0024843700|nr:uncharacterized protein LOC129792415 [Lutzomyia longipalpis]
MRGFSVICLVILTKVSSVFSDAATDFNNVNPDGSFSFGLNNEDIGGHYHMASGNPKTIIRGRYGSRNPSTKRVEETVYTAGPRGFRARGPAIARKMDLSQIRRGPIGSPDDPLADPFDDPSYSFGFKTPTYTRQEDADPAGRVKGLYSYVDDIGEKHLVRYAAGKEEGYNVINSYPDAPNYVKYSTALYKSPNKRTRGRIAIQRGPGGQYNFISSGPDQRRSESSGPDGIVRGSYSYLDDKGVQRTVQYIAGAGIGYKIVQSTTGPGTHNLPRPAIPEFGVLTPESNDLGRDTPHFNDDGVFNTASTTRPHRKEFGSSPRPSVGDDGGLGGGDFGDDGTGYFDGNDNSYDQNSRDPNAIVPLPPPSVRPGRPYRPRGRGSTPARRNSEEVDYTDLPGVTPSLIDTTGIDVRDEDGGFGGGPDPNFDRERPPLPSGVAVRAHVQNIDLIPEGGSAPSPGEALLRDEQRNL